MIASTIVPSERRINFLPSITKHYYEFENALCQLMAFFCPDYSGAYWEYIELNNGGKFAFPKGEKFELSNNHRSFELTPEAAGIVISLVALSSYSIATYEAGDHAESQKLGNIHAALFDYAITHDEINSIYTLID
ncbi:putative Antirestriction protein klcA [Vibrio nigripulchritudo FTn2]|uniref:antirestriction protein n=1 Tax=Vibrio nigripulchritudo TaxID=28173 RepID=UPI0003B1F7EA|nr:antirestriction protein [Vibrio nigripulchritudo]CCN40623.1 putative Antirestriction protein klcA [Vibrio nigripulchritudo FTn2]